MKNNATCTIRSEKITIDVRICAALAANRGGEVYLAAIAPDMELTVITLDEAPDILPCFEEDDACLNLPNTSLLLCYNPAQVLKMGGKHYLTGPVILARTNMDGEVISLTMYDELALDTLGDKKTALFLIMSDTDSTFNFLISMVYTQLFNLLCDKADDVYGGKLPIHVRCLIDECANIGQIPNLEKLVATIRSREISACLVLQARSQLKAIYKDNADTIVGNMDSQIFLGGSEPTTLKDLSEMLGKETIDAFNTSDTRGNSPSYGTTFQKMGHELLSRDELAVLDGGKCILQLRGVRPFLSDKYDLTQHPNYKLTSDYDPKNTFDIEKYLNRKEKIHPGDEFIVVDADSLPSA